MSVRILLGDVRERLAGLPDESVHCVVTSPPYFGLRDYGTASWEGGDPDCDHAKVSDAVAAVATSTLGGGKKSTGHLQEGYKSKCGRCGAIRADKQIGLEPTPAAFVAVMVDVFREVRRVLRNDGTCWINLGDSYNSHDPGGYREGEFLNPGGRQSEASKGARNKAGNHVDGLKRKDMIGIPWRVAFALQADGWYLRQDIIWAKPNPMPESVTDRCTKAHEYLFLLSKSARYHFDAAAISEASTHAGKMVRTNGNEGMDGGYDGHRTRDGLRRGVVVAETRNKRSVWEVPSAPFSEAHFATFPPALIEPCILAGCPKGGTVLDPFGGAGTTGLVADRLGRDAVLIELNPEYAEIARKRIHGDSSLFADVAVTPMGVFRPSTAPAVLPVSGEPAA